MRREPPEGYISSAEACRILRISPRTLGRRVKDGEIEGEYLPRPQGSVLYVKLPPDAAEQAAGDAAPDGGAATEEPDAARDTRQDTALAALLLDRLEAKDAAILAATERAVKAEGERDAARQAAQAADERIRELRAELDRERDRSWWHRLWGIYPNRT